LISEGVDEQMYFGGSGKAKAAPARISNNPDEEGRNAGFLAPAESKEDAQRIMNEINEEHIEAVFVNSQHYTAECIVNFVNELCLVALAETHNPKEPRIFTSQKIVEVAHYNMDRIRIVWLRIWQLMSQHFFKAGCHPNSHISMYAIDSLRQLAIKFLSKDELESFTFQKDFLNPFVLILQNNNTEDAHEIVIRCFEQVVQAKATKLKSGWETILTVLSLTANDNFPNMLSVGFQVLENLLQNHFGGVSEYWEQLSECLVAFALNPHDTTVGNKAIKHLKGLCQKLVEGSVASCCPTAQGGFSSAEGHGKGWCTLLSAFRVIAWDSRAALGYQGVEAMFGVLIEHGACWDTDVWQMVLKQVVFETIDAAKGAKETPAEEKQRQEWINKSCGTALTLLIDVFAHHLERLQPLWEDLVMYLYSLVAQPDLELALEGMKMLDYLINSLGAKINNELWDTLLKVVGLIFETSTPREFVDAAVKSAAADEELLDMTATPKNSPFNNTDSQQALEGESPSPSAANKWQPPTAVQFEAMRLMCTVQLLLIKVTGEMYESHGSRLLSRHILVLVECLEGACKFAHDFNMNRGARTKLWNPELRQDMPDLIEQETSALRVYLTILSNLYCETEVEMAVRREIAETRLLSTVDIITARYIAKTLKPTMLPEEMPEMMAFTGVIVQILTAVKNFDDEQFQRHLGEHIYPNVVELTECSKIEVRRLVREILLRVGKVCKISNSLPEQ
jgi:brefeldin A-inhibited guanine nucleotide-exchange protein